MARGSNQSSQGKVVKCYFAENGKIDILRKVSEN